MPTPEDVREPESVIYSGCRVVWSTWDGGRFGRKRRREHVLDDVIVTVKGDWATVRLPDGRTMRKNIGGNWFRIRYGEQR